MSETMSLDRQVQALARAQKYPGESPRSEPVAGPACTIALTRESGTPATDLARVLGRRLGWPVYDHELLELISRESGAPLRRLEELDEHRQNWILECLEGMTLNPGLSEDAFVRCLERTILALGRQGRCVIVGRGAALLLPPSTTLRVRLVARWEDRVKSLSERLHVDPSEAARQAERLGRDRDRFVRDHFQADPSDLRHYDLVLNASSWSVAECADVIVQALRDRQGRLARLD